MKLAFKEKVLLVSAVAVLLGFIAGQAAAQENYPVPKGDPSTWGIPGHAKKLPVEPEAGPPNMFSAPRPWGNESLSRPSGPAGEAEETYTGTRVFGDGIGGTGIDRNGPLMFW